jgi:hypothetical protein
MIQVHVRRNSVHCVLNPFLPRVIEGDSVLLLMIRIH